MICAALAYSLSTGTRIRIGMHGCDNTFRLSSTVSRFSYISGVVNSQRAGPEVRITSQLFVLLLRASLQRLPRSQLQEGMGVKGVTLPQSSSQPPDGPPFSKAAREQEEYQQVLEITLNLIASLGHLPGLIWYYYMP